MKLPGQTFLPIHISTQPPQSHCADALRCWEFLLINSRRCRRACGAFSCEATEDDNFAWKRSPRQVEIVRRLYESGGKYGESIYME